MEIEVSVRLEDSSFLFGERRQRCVGERREDFVHQAGQSATPKQLEVLAHLLGAISSENFSCSISIAKFE